MPIIPTTDPTDFGNEPGTGPLRVGGQPGQDVVKDANNPAHRSKASEAQMGALGVVRDLWGGNPVVKEKGRTYLPQDPGEEAEYYRARLNRSVFTNFYRRTVEGLVGLMFRVDPVLGDDVPTQIVKHWENIDQCGTHGDVFCRDIETDAQNAGHAAILIEFPNTGGDQRRDEERAIAPYWVPIMKDNIISWRTTNENGRLILTQIVLREAKMVDVGAFGEVEQVRYRVLRREGVGADARVTFQLLEVTKDKQVIVHEEGEYPTQDEIPLVEVPTSGRKSLFVSDPPLLDVGYLNIAHYQMDSDQKNAIHKTNCPFVVVQGHNGKDDDGNPIKLLLGGGNTAIFLPDPQGDAGYRAHDGNSLSATKDALDDLKSDMGTLGLAMLSPQKRTAETAEAKRLDKATSDSALSVSARGLQDALERALYFHARYLRLDSGGSIAVNRDFEGLMMDAPVMTAYAILAEKVGLPEHVVLRVLRDGGRLPDDVDIEEIELEMMVAREAQRKAQEQAREDDLQRAQEAMDNAA